MKKGNDKNNPKNKDVNLKGCWTCGGHHLAKSCPNKERVNALLAGKVNQDKEGEEVLIALVNPIGLSFNHITLVKMLKGLLRLQIHMLYLFIWK